ncbi:MDR/zinc-dependent alcohol dehydrogenase-like family protein [Rufibacter radiotolerans]|uniref:hypothetical protein n=1 Tax=Rufibacter radiotolerans TaxID=1379910 RepID=UPI0018CDF844|nr:hypothetical protein [Rufibacter radiotolerans]
MQNKTYILKNKFELTIQEEELDVSNLLDNEIVGQTIYSCVSPGTELAAYQGFPPLRPGMQYPRLMGYCNVGKVIKVGSTSTGVSEGDVILTFTSHQKYFKIKANEVIAVLGRNIDYKLASAVYLFHLGYMATIESGAQPGMKVGVMGTGTLGYGTALLCNQFGFKTHVFSNQVYLQDELKADGISFSAKERIETQSYFNSFDIIINTSNSWEDWFLSMELLRKKGTMVNLGFPGRGLALPEINPLDSRFFYDKQLTLKSAGYVYDGEATVSDVQFSLKRNINYLLGLIAAGRLDPKRLISKEVKWEQLSELYDFLLIRGTRKFTGILNWTENA